MESYYDVTILFKNGREKKFIHCRLTSVNRIVDKYWKNEDVDDIQIVLYEDV